MYHYDIDYMLYMVVIWAAVMSAFDAVRDMPQICKRYSAVNCRLVSQGSFHNHKWQKTQTERGREFRGIKTHARNLIFQVPIYASFSCSWDRKWRVESLQKGCFVAYVYQMWKAWYYISMRIIELARLCSAIFFYGTRFVNRCYKTPPDHFVLCALTYPVYHGSFRNKSKPTLAVWYRCSLICAVGNRTRFLSSEMSWN